MPKTEERYTEYLGVRLESDLMDRIRRRVKGLRPKTNVTEWVRRVLWEAVSTKPQTQQQKEP